MFDPFCVSFFPGPSSREIGEFGESSYAFCGLPSLLSVSPLCFQQFCFDQISPLLEEWDSVMRPAMRIRALRPNAELGRISPELICSFMRLLHFGVAVGYSNISNWHPRQQGTILLQLSIVLLFLEF